MKAIDKAIWYIENHYREQVSLDSLAAVAGVSRYHLSRIFCYAVGQPISRYIRLRRLSTAAVSLVAGETDILDLALSIGYGSHEAFRRAFKEHFSITPEQVRAQGNTEDLNLTEAFSMHSMQQDKAAALAEPRLEELGELKLAGISRFYSFAEVAEIPDQWQSFAPLIPRLSAESCPVAYGAIYNGSDSSFDYLSGVEAPWFERYGHDFDPLTGAGGLEIWIPVSG